jgi:uncharacterized protein RhaS with RHS repeats
VEARGFYGYVTNDPINLIDPEGLRSYSIVFGNARGPAHEAIVGVTQDKDGNTRFGLTYENWAGNKGAEFKGLFSQSYSTKHGLRLLRATDLGDRFDPNKVRNTGRQSDYASGIRQCTTYSDEKEGKRLNNRGAPFMTPGLRPGLGGSNEGRVL